MRYRTNESTAEPNPDRTVYCLCENLPDHVELRIYRLGAMQLTYEGETIGERTAMVKASSASDPVELGDDLDLWLTFSTSELWGAVDELLNYRYVDLDLSDIVERYVDFRLSEVYDTWSEDTVSESENV